jgi:hypothetical protein
MALPASSPLGPCMSSRFPPMMAALPCTDSSAGFSPLRMRDIGSGHTTRFRESRRHNSSDRRRQRTRELDPSGIYRGMILR